VLTGSGLVMESWVYEPVGVGGLQPPKLGQNHYFSGKAKFFRQKPRQQPKMKKVFFVFIKRKNGIHSV